MVIGTRFARFLTVALISLLFLGTLMPGRWKDAAAAPFESPFDLAVLAHIGMFAVICFMIPIARLWPVKLWQLPALGLGLALLTEGLQFFAIDRHPNLAGVYQDMVGTLVAFGWHGALGLPVARAAREPVTQPTEP
jgi:hypothetical protein